MNYLYYFISTIIFTCFAHFKILSVVKIYENAENFYVTENSYHIRINYALNVSYLQFKIFTSLYWCYEEEFMYFDAAVLL